MFKDYESKLGDQLTLVTGGTMKDYTGTQFSYANSTDTNVSAETKKVLLPERDVRTLIGLFEESIDPDTFEHIVAFGQDVGMGLLSFADFRKDPSCGLYLAYRETAMPILGLTPEFYLGVYPNPCDYDKIASEGLENNISVSKDGLEARVDTEGDLEKCAEIIRDFEIKSKEPRSAMENTTQLTQEGGSE